MDDSELLTVSQAAAALNATSQTIRNWIREERLPGRRIGNRFVIPREAVERLRGDPTVQRSESLWDYGSEEQPRPLPRKAVPSGPANEDPVAGLLGA